MYLSQVVSSGPQFFSLVPWIVFFPIITRPATTATSASMAVKLCAAASGRATLTPAASLNTSVFLPSTFSKAVS